MTTLPEPVALQFWSHQEITPEIRQQIETILEGGDAQCAAHAGESPLLKSDTWTGANESSNPPTQQSSAAPTSEPERAADNPNIKQTQQGIWVLVNDSHISRWVEEHGSLYHDKQTLPKVLPEIPVGGVVVDVGANIGDSTAPFLERVGATGRVYAAEPNPDARECLRRNLGQAPNLVISPMAFGDVDRRCNLDIQDNAGASSIDFNGDGIELRRLDSLLVDRSADDFLLDRLDFLKIDVEGFELRVLKGAEQTINRFRPKMLIEVNRGALARQGATVEQLLQWLANHDYGADIVQEGATFGDEQYDVLCTYMGSDDHGPGSWVVHPWESYDESVAEIQSLAERLKKFCGNSSQTRAVRLELHRQGVIELPYRFKRRKKWRKRKAKA